MLVVLVFVRKGGTEFMEKRDAYFILDLVGGEEFLNQTGDLYINFRLKVFKMNFISNFFSNLGFISIRQVNMEMNSLLSPKF